MNLRYCIWYTLSDSTSSVQLINFLTTLISAINICFYANICFCIDLFVGFRLNYVHAIDIWMEIVFFKFNFSISNFDWGTYNKGSFLNCDVFELLWSFFSSVLACPLYLAIFAFFFLWNDSLEKKLWKINNVLCFYLLSQ